MTAQQKALELIEKFKPYMYCYMGSGMLSNSYDAKIELANAKQCALICCDEVINTYQDIDPKKSFWVEVRKEITRI